VLLPSATHVIFKKGRGDEYVLDQAAKKVGVLVSLFSIQPTTQPPCRSARACTRIYITSREKAQSDHYFFLADGTLRRKRRWVSRSSFERFSVLPARRRSGVRQWSASTPLHCEAGGARLSGVESGVESSPWSTWSAECNHLCPGSPS